MTRNKNIYCISDEGTKKIDTHHFSRCVLDSIPNNGDKQSLIEVGRAFRKLLDGHFVEVGGIKYVLAADQLEFDKVVEAWFDKEDKED